ncbi:MAG: spermidine synthase [Actinobacteria bacterium]|nr:spermidine synthase [Actinomycetota bacterium]
MRGGDRSRLFLASFLMLFVELVLIRWLGAYVVYLSYFSNFVLLGSFLGIGIGFIRGPRGDWFKWSPVLLASTLALSRIFPVSIDRTGGQILFFGTFHRSGLPVWITLPVVFVIVAATMAAIGQGVAVRFARFPPLEAYRLDILGSIAGIATFSLMSLAGAPPVAWCAVIAAIFIAVLRPSISMLQVVALATLLLISGRDLLDAGVTWSPYYRITYGEIGTGAVEVLVNGIPHQTITTIELRRQTEPTYFIPYERAVGNPLDRVLIVGAGTGTDVAIALSEGAKHVDAVEIDPKLFRLGKDLNPGHPYQDPRVSVHVGDGRAFLEQTDGTYDLILFALPDSLTLVSGQSSLRLESYLFTEEAMQAARDRLAPGGVFAMYNYYRTPWLVDRLANTLDEVYGHPPCFDSSQRVGYLALLTTSIDSAAVDCPRPWAPLDPPVTAPATDDRPFVYLRTASIPPLYTVALSLILLASVIAVRAVSGPFGSMRAYADLFFMGVAFLLLETKNVVQFALLFGTTWFVNALVFGGILVTVLMAIEVAKRVRLRRPARLYGLLAVAVAVAYLVPVERLLDLGTVPRFLIATALAFAPIFFANLVFAERFQNVESSTSAFGANLLGAMVGGCLEYGALVIGYRALLIVAAALYGLAFLTGRKFLRAPAGAPGSNRS